MALSWVSVDALTGQILAELPDLTPQGPCVVTMGRYETLGFKCPYPASVVTYSQQDPSDRDPQDQAIQDLADWNIALRPGGVVVIALDESNNPIWGGLVLSTEKDHTEAVTLTTATMEAYLDRRYTGAYLATGVDQNQIVADLIDQFIADGTLPGLPIRVANSVSAHTQSVTYNNYDDKTVYSNLGSLSGVLNGPQWTIGWELQAGPLITPVLTVADRLGSPVRPGFTSPNAVFSMPGAVSAFKLTEDWSSGKGANRVTANGQGQGLTRPTAVVNATDFQARPTFEFRYSPQAVGTLTVSQHAMAAMAALKNGTKVITITAAITGAPVLGEDWFLGDDIGYDIFAPGFIDGSLQGGIGRCVGWQRDDNFVAPVLFTQDVTTL